jgi:hypothetical protein
VGPQGQLITAPAVATVFSAVNAYQWVRRFQLQEQAGNVLLLLVEPHREPLASQQTELIGQMEALAGSSYEVKLELRDALPLAPSGKHQHVIPLARPAGAAPGTRAVVDQGHRQTTR